jgi:anti-sigma regulatory factor (Ser/Thr protein kinase)
MGLFEFLGINPEVKDIEEHESAGRLIRLQQIKSSEDLDMFLKDLVPLLHLEREPHARAIQHIFSELIRNVLEHSCSPHGAVVCAQYFKRSNRIAIGVVDNGVGLTKTISKSHTVTDDLHAIRLALTPGITGTTSKPGGSSQNAGFGLFLIKSIAFLNFDYFTIISGGKLYKLLQRPPSKTNFNTNPLNDRHSIMNTPYWQGVAVGVDISLDQTQEFTGLLDMIYKFYSGEVKGQKKQRCKKPVFI